MSHSSEKRWPFVSGVAEATAVALVNVLIEIESKYQDLLEMYAYAGNTAQGLADLLFLDEWSIRETEGDQAILSFDVTAGIIDDVVINDGGTGYDDGIGFLIPVQGGAGDGVIRYDVVAGVVTNASIDNGGTTYTNGVGQNLNGFPAAGLIPDTQASAAEVSICSDLISAMTSAHEIYQASNNVAVGAEDRLTALRRFT